MLRVAFDPSLRLRIEKDNLPGLGSVENSVDVVSRLDYTTQVSDSPTVCTGSRQEATAMFEP